MRWTRVVGAWVVGAAVVATAAFAQGNPTGRLSGRVSSNEGALPGVTVTATSPNLQGQRVVQTNANGDYLFAALPPGEYALTFELSGFDAQTAAVRVPALQDTRHDVNLSLTTVAETITVTGEGSVISQATTAGASYDAQLIEDLPIGRTFAAQAFLAPGVSATGPTQALTISGAMSFENLFTVNGVVVNENLRGQAFNLFIPDAVQEVSTSTAGISAEYGRFTGGVVNLLTKSGGNEFSGSLGSTMNNQDWVSEPPISNPREDKITPTYEATLGGRIVRDRLWFFVAGLSQDLDQGRQTFLLNSPYDFTDETRRYEGKLTAGITPSHTLLGSIIDEERDITNFDVFGTALEPAALDAQRGQPQRLWSANYTGIFTQSLYGEVQYSEREFTFVDSGGDDGDLIRGTPFTDSALSSATYHAPYFCGAPCLDEERNNENLVAKMSAFLSTKSLGTHDVVVGYDTFNDIRVSENHQSATDYTLGAPAIIRDGAVYPQLIPGVSYVVWWPIPVETQGTDFKSNSLFVNDRWQLNDRWSFNVGLRYDENDGRNAQGITVSKDDNISPRLGVSWDVKGDGDWVLNAQWGRYVAALANNVADSSSQAGVPATYAWIYDGPVVNGDPDAAVLVDGDEAARIFFDWFNSVGGTNNQDYLFFTRLPGVDRIISADGLKSPNVEEIKLGLTKQFGSRASLRADYIRRDFTDMYLIQRDRTTGIVTNDLGQSFDLSVVRNARGDELVREYDALQLQANVRFTDRLTLGGNYTWSNVRGNVNGEAANTGPIATATGSYPEYIAFAQNNPEGDLATDQRHKARVWVNWSLLQSDRQRLTLSVLQNYFSGTPYGASANVHVRSYVADQGYVTPPLNSVYFFTDRDEFRTDDITATDLSLNYSFSIKAGNRDVELFLQPEVLNIFDEDGVVVVNQTNVLTAANSSIGLQRFNPFTETPVEGVHYVLGPNFGQATREADFQTPRTFRVRLGVRF